MDSVVLQLWHTPLSLKFLIFSQWFPHLWALCMSFQRKFLTPEDRLHQFFVMASQILSFGGCEPLRLEVASLIRSRFIMAFLFMDSGMGWDLWIRQ